MKIIFNLLQFTDNGIEGVVPLELLPSDVRTKFQSKSNDRGKRAKKEEAKGAAHQVEENQVSRFISNLPFFSSHQLKRKNLL